MTAAEDFDPYLLPLPAPASPIVAPHLASPLHAHLNGRYGDPVWPLAPLTGNPSTRKPSIYWEHWPAAFRDEMRLAAWICPGTSSPAGPSGSASSRQPAPMPPRPPGSPPWRHTSAP